VSAAIFGPGIDNYMKWIQHRPDALADGTLARNRPLPNSLWLDESFHEQSPRSRRWGNSPAIAPITTMR